MACALMKYDSAEMAVHSDLDDAFSAALQRAMSVGPSQKNSVISMISKEEWKNMDATADDPTVRDE